MKRRILSMLLIFVLVLTSIIPAYGIEDSPSGLEIRGLNGNWDEGTYPLVQVEPYVWKGTFELDSSIEQNYKGYNQGGWLGYRTDGNTPIAITENTPVTFTYYEHFDILLDSVNYPNGLLIKMTGSKDELGPWSPISSQYAMTPVTESLYKVSVPLSADESFEYKLFFNPDAEHEWSESSTDNNMTFNNDSSDQTIDF